MGLDEDKCPDCKHCIIIEGFELDPICNINDGIECGRKKTWRSFEPRKERLILKEGGLGEMLNQIKKALED